jgi:hypothetical protein
MRSKTLQLIKRYYRIIEQDEQDPNAVMQQAPLEGQEAPPEGQAPEMPAEEPETTPLTSTAEIRYIQDVVLALLYGELSEDDKTKLEQLEIVLKNPKKAQQLMSQTGKTGKDFYQEEILPIIKPIRDDQDTLNNLNSIS